MTMRIVSLKPCDEGYEFDGRKGHIAIPLCSAKATIQVQYAICCIWILREKGSSIGNLVGRAEAAKRYSRLQLLLALEIWWPGRISQMLVFIGMGTRHEQHSLVCSSHPWIEYPKNWMQDGTERYGRLAFAHGEKQQ